MPRRRPRDGPPTPRASTRARVAARAGPACSVTPRAPASPCGGARPGVEGSRSAELGAPPRGRAASVLTSEARSGREARRDGWGGSADPAPEEGASPRQGPHAHAPRHAPLETSMARRAGRWVTLGSSERDRTLSGLFFRVRTYSITRSLCRSGRPGSGPIPLALRRVGGRWPAAATRFRGDHTRLVLKEPAVITDIGNR